MNHIQKTKKLVQVEWLDSFGGHGWENDKNWTLRDGIVSSEITSAGWIIEQNDEAILLVSTFNHEHYHAPLVIPRCSIKSILPLEVPKVGLAVEASSVTMPDVRSFGSQQGIPHFPLGTVQNS